MKHRVMIGVAVAAGMAFWAGCNGQAGQDMYTYEVQPGQDSFADVAAVVYGDGDHAAPIARANPEATDGKLQSGQELTIPERTNPETGQRVPPKQCERKSISR